MPKSALYEIGDDVTAFIRFTKIVFDGKRMPEQETPEAKSKRLGIFLYTMLSSPARERLNLTAEQVYNATQVEDALMRVFCPTADSKSNRKRLASSYQKPHESIENFYFRLENIARKINTTPAERSCLIIDAFENGLARDIVRMQLQSHRAGMEREETDPLKIVRLAEKLDGFLPSRKDDAKQSKTDECNNTDNSKHTETMLKSLHGLTSKLDKLLSIKTESSQQHTNVNAVAGHSADTLEPDTQTTTVLDHLNLKLDQVKNLLATAQTNPLQQTHDTMQQYAPILALQNQPVSPRYRQQGYQRQPTAHRQSMYPINSLDIQAPQNRRCYICGDPNHLAIACQFRQQRRPQLNCRKCNKPGHLQRDCRSRPEYNQYHRQNQCPMCHDPACMGAAHHCPDCFAKISPTPALALRHVAVCQGRPLAIQARNTSREPVPEKDCFGGGARPQKNA